MVAIFHLDYKQPPGWQKINSQTWLRNGYSLSTCYLKIAGLSIRTADHSSGRRQFFVAGLLSHLNHWNHIFFYFGPIFRVWIVSSPDKPHSLRSGADRVLGKGSSPALISTVIHTQSHTRELTPLEFSSVFSDICIRIHTCITNVDTHGQCHREPCPEVCCAGVAYVSTSNPIDYELKRPPMLTRHWTTRSDSDLDMRWIDGFIVTFEAFRC